MLPRRQNVHQPPPQDHFEIQAHHPSSADTDYNLSVIRDILNNMSQLTPRTRCNPDSFTGRHLVSRAVRQFDRAVASENGSSSSINAWDVENINMSITRKTKAEITISTADLLNEILRAIDESPISSVDQPLQWFAKETYKTIATALDQIFTELEGVAFSYVSLVNVAVRTVDCADALLHFLTTNDAGQDSISDIYALHVFNRLIAILCPLCTNLSCQEGDPAFASSARKALKKCTQRVFTILCTTHVLPRLESTLTRNRASTETMPILDNAPEIDAIVLCHHVFVKLYNVAWPSLFNSALEKSIEIQASNAKAHMLPRITKLLAFVCPILELDEYGMVASTEDGKCYSAWELLAANIESYLKDLINSTIPWSTSVNSFIMTLLEWCYKLVRVWKWPRPAALVQALSRVYNKNGMRALVPNVRDPIEWDKLNGLSDSTLELAMGDTDFDIYLKLVGLALSMTADVREASDPKFMSRMRSLVWSLCPNTGRLLPGDQQLEREKLAAFVNHCMLYLVLSKHSPKGCKPRLSIFEDLSMLADAHMSVWRALITTWHLLVPDTINDPVDSDFYGLDDLTSWLEIMLAQMNNRYSKMVKMAKTPPNLDLSNNLNRNAQVVSDHMRMLLEGWRNCLTSCRDIDQFQNLFMVHRWPCLFAACSGCAPARLAFLDVLMAGFDHMVTLPGNGKTWDALMLLFRDIFSNSLFQEHRVHDLFLKSLASAWVSFASHTVLFQARSWDTFLDTHSPLNAIRLIAEPLCHKFSILVWLRALERSPQLYNVYESQLITMLWECLVKTADESNRSLEFIERCLELATVSRKSPFFHQEWRPVQGAPRTLAVVGPLYISKMINMLAKAATEDVVGREDVRQHLKALGQILKNECDTRSGLVVNESPVKDLEILIAEVQAFIEGLRRNHISYIKPHESLYELLAQHLGMDYVTMIRTSLPNLPQTTEIESLLAATHIDAVRDIRVLAWAYGEQDAMPRHLRSTLKSRVSLEFYTKFPLSPYDLQRDFTTEFKYITQNFKPYLEVALCDPHLWLSRKVLQLLYQLFANSPTQFLLSKAVRKYTARYFECALSVLKSVIKALRQAGTDAQHPAIHQFGDNNAMQDNFIQMLRLSRAIILQFAESYSVSSSEHQSKHLDALHGPFKSLSASMKRYFDQLNNDLAPIVRPLPLQNTAVSRQSQLIHAAIQRSFYKHNEAHWTVTEAPAQGLRFWKHGRRPGVSTGYESGIRRGILKREIDQFVQSVPAFVNTEKDWQIEMIGELLDGVSVPVRDRTSGSVIDEYERRFEE